MIIYPNINPVIINIYGILGIRWYQLPYIFGILYIQYFIKKYYQNLNFKNTQEVERLMSYVIAGLILGARLGYVLFYDFLYYMNHVKLIFYIWEGGLSFHGGVLGILLSLHIFKKKHKHINVVIILDSIIHIVPIFLFFGRIANFINGELYGRISNCSICMIFPNNPFPRHPSQIYQALIEGLCVFIILNIIKKYQFTTQKGFMTIMFVILYSVSRFFVEFFREPDSQIGYIMHYLSMGQVLCILSIIFGLIWIKYNVKHN